jgi:hypothetical protein
VKRELSLVVRRLPGKGVRVRIEASDGSYVGIVELWCGAERVAALGQGLADFPSKAPSSIEFYFEEPEETQNFTLRAYAGVSGITGLELSLKAEHAECWVSDRVEAAAINRLGALFLDMAQSDEGSFRWSPTVAEAVPGSNEED